MPYARSSEPAAPADARQERRANGDPARVFEFRVDRILDGTEVLIHARRAAG